MDEGTGNVDVDDVARGADEAAEVEAEAFDEVRRAFEVEVDADVEGVCISPIDARLRSSGCLLSTIGDIDS